MAQDIEIDPVSVVESGQKSMQSAVEGSMPGTVPVGGMSSLQDGVLASFTSALASRAGLASATLMPRGPQHFAETAAGLGELTSTEAANAAQTVSIQSLAL